MSKFTDWCDEKGYNPDGVFVVCGGARNGEVKNGVEVKLKLDDESINPPFTTQNGEFDSFGDNWLHITFEDHLTQNTTKSEKNMTNELKTGDSIRFNDAAKTLKSYDVTAAGMVLNPTVANGICSAKWKKANGEVFYTTSLSTYKVDKVSEDKCGLNPGDAVKFSDKAKELKSYDKDAEGTIIRAATYGGKVELNNWCVWFKYDDGRELTIPVINSDKLVAVTVEEQIAVLEGELIEAENKRGHIESHLKDADIEIQSIIDKINVLKI